MLNDPIAFSRHLYRDSPLIEDLTAWFFDINILSRLAGPTRHQAMPMIGGGDRNHINIFVFQCLSYILGRFGGLVWLFAT